MLWLAVLPIVVILGLLAYLDTRKPKKFPPGPKWYPLVGSAIQVHKARSRLGSLFEATAEMSMSYGPILGIKIGKDPIVVVYGPQEVRELAMSEDLLGRPIGPFFEMRTWNKKRGILLTDNEFWQEQKRFLIRQLREFGFGTKNMSILVEEECSHLLSFINNAMDTEGSVIINMESLFNVSVLNTIWKMMAGVRYSSWDPKMKTLQAILADLFRTIHMVGASFSHFPILKYIAPEISGYKLYKDTHSLIWDFLQEELEQHKKTHDPDQPRDLMDVYLNVIHSPDHGKSFSEKQLLAVCMDMFMAGSETTSNTLSFCFLYLILNSHVQKKAQEEIDTILGDRLPSLDDRPNMPYIEAIVLEALRMFGCRAFAIPHRALRDTYLAGYLIPKDVLVTANFHGCMMGPESGFDDPEQFRPERYLKNGKISLPENHIPFGLGKRRCMGETLARANIFLFTAGLLQNYDFHMVPDSPPDMKIVDGVTPAPIHYKARITHRKS